MTGTGKKKALERFVVKWRFSKTRPDEMDLDKGDVVLVSAKFNDGWYKGIRLRGYKVGYFPADYVDKEPLEESDGIEIPSEKLGELSCITNPQHSNSISGDAEPKELDLDSKRTKTAEEILSTEVSYCNGLGLVVEHFIEPMRIYGVLSVEEIEIIFSNVESLAGISKELVSKLKTRLNEWDVKKTEIGDVLLEMFNYLKMFKPYFDSRSTANRLRVRYEKSNELFKTFLSKVNCGHTLDSLLLMPIQRIPRYELLLKELVKRTDVGHPDYENLLEALTKARETASDLNEHIRQIENESKIFEIIKMFPNDELDLIINDTATADHSPGLHAKKFKNSPSLPRKMSPHIEVDDRMRRSWSLTDIQKVDPGTGMQHSPSDPSVNHSLQIDDVRSHIFRTRMFIHEGPVQKVIFKNNNATGIDSLGELSDRYLILFSDIAIVAVEAGNVITGNKFKLKERINLSQCWIADQAESFLKKQVPPETFVLGTPKRTYIFQAPTVKDKTIWQKFLWKRISLEKQKFFLFWKNKEVADNIFVKATVKSKVEYLSMNKCELDLHFNEDVSVIGYRKDGLWIPGLSDANNISNSFISDWLPGVSGMGKFGWFPAECVPGHIFDNKDKPIDHFTYVSVATALNIKREMLELTQSPTPLKFLTSVKIFRVDGTFRTCKLNETTTTEDVIIHLDKHNRSCGLNIDKDCIEIWEESKDGSVKRKHKQNEKILEIISLWGEYQSQLSFVAHFFGMKECIECLMDPAIEVTIERRQSRGTSPLKRKHTATEQRRQAIIAKSASFPETTDSNTTVNDN